MPRDTLSDLTAFLEVARARSFTRAAAGLGVSQSALSQTIAVLEERLGVRLLTRTTRSVAPTAAGERLLARLGPHFDGISAELAALGELRDKPAGTVRVTTSEHAAATRLWPVLERFLPQHPDIKVELNIESGLTDIVAERFDAGVRLGEQVEKDMVAVRIGPDLRMAAVASPAYLAGHPAPQTPHDLARHECINLRLPTLGGFYPWEFEKDGRALNVRVDGRLAFNNARLILQAAEAGFGIGFLPEDHVQQAMAAGRLMRLLADWCPLFPGFHLYYPSRRQPTPAFALLVEALRHRG
ncbi:LysR family transcriptional regulator [Acidocella sp.]|jgi:DNA-binding transcriptional LysR family regulator|uniref:LysR family transcriptional regulator n=1 Tax=Acidocella sp. TaxID=50710 RepID=UPI002F3E6D6B